MIFRSLIAICVLFAASAAHAEPAVRGVFVGIDKYLYSRANVSGATFSDLEGAVADANVFKQALQAAYRLDLDQPVAGQCDTRNLISITLTDNCATRDAIFDALATQIGASAPGDTIIFYFAGHGSRLADDQRLDQPSGFNDTLLPTDARKPRASESNDILDREIRKVIDIANARGVNFVTIFDSCNSGTGSRMIGAGGMAPVGRSRGVFGIEVSHHADYTIPLSASGPGGGYRVHFGAARDDEEAREVRNGATYNGVFTTALAREIIARPDATYGDLATAVRIKVGQAGHHSQHPQAEGQLQASFLGGANNVALFEATPNDDSVTLAAGRLLGVTRDSKFALFASEREALTDGATPLARGVVTSLDDGQAVIQLGSIPAAPLPEVLIARETEHAFGNVKLSVAFSGCNDQQTAMVHAALAETGLARAASADVPATLNLTSNACTNHAAMALFTEDAVRISRLGPLDDPSFPERLRKALLPIYNVRRLVALQTENEQAAKIELCLTHKLDQPVRRCPEPAGRERVLETDKPVDLTVINASNSARFIHVLVIDERYAIMQLIPANDGVDPAMGPYMAQRLPWPLKFDAPGLYRFVVFASDARINTSVLQQPSVRRDLSSDCDPEIEGQQRCEEEAGGSRGGSAPSLGQWSIVVADVIVRRPRDTGAPTTARFEPFEPVEPIRANLGGSDTPGASPSTSGDRSASGDGSPAPASADEPVEDDGRTRIVGGTTADPGTAPWQAEIYTTYQYTQADTDEDNQREASKRYYLADKADWEKIHRCAGAYIGDNFVLTAAHCIHGIDDFGAKRRVQLGTQYLDTPGVNFKIVDWVAHKHFRNEIPYPNDIAILKIEADNPAAKAADLASMKIRLIGTKASDVGISPGDSLRVTGWGRTKAREEGQIEIARDGTRNFMSAELKQINQRKDDEACATQDDFKDILPGKAICAVPINDGEDSCNGDSGGPMTLAEGVERVLVGLVSWGKGCALRGLPSIYTEVSGYRDWIEKAKKELRKREARRQREEARHM